MKNLEQYDSIEVMTQEFNNWFGIWLSGWDNINNRWDEEIDRSINAFTDDIIDIMLAITGWDFDDDELKIINKMNLVYWYCVRLMYLYNDNYYYIENVFEFLDGVRPFNP